MAENELQILVNGIVSRIKEKYGYTDEQVLIYLKWCEDCAEENQQSLEKRDKMLRNTVEELCEAKRLLKLAVEDFAESLGVMYTCPYCKYHHRERETCAERETQYCKGICKWRYADEALKLLGEDGDTGGITIQETEV